MKTHLATTALFALAACLLGATSAHGQADLSFSGGPGGVLHLTLNQPVAYTITTAQPANNAPSFVFQDVGNEFNGFPAVTGTITFSVNGGPDLSLTGAGSGYNGNAQTAPGLFLRRQ